jgi:hypothetical protein
MTMKKTMLVATFLYILFLFFNDFYGWEEQSKFLGLIFSDPLSIHLSDLVGFGHIQSWQLGVGGGYYSRESLAFSVAPESGTVGILFGWSALLVLVDFDLESLQVGEGLPGGVGDHAELDGLPVVRDADAELRQIADGPQATLTRPQHQAVVGLFQDDGVQQADGSDGLLEVLVTLLREGLAMT